MDVVGTYLLARGTEYSTGVHRFQGWLRDSKTGGRVAVVEGGVQGLGL